MKRIRLLFVLLFVFIFVASCDYNINQEDKTNDDYHNITYIVDGTVINKELVKDGELLTEPNNPESLNGLFIGWYNGNLKWDFNENKVYADITLKAVFSNDENIPVYQGMSIKTFDHNPKLRYHQSSNYIPNFDIIETPGVNYFVHKNDTYLLEIHLLNPKSYEILSFSLNGEKYQSYQFKEGSTSTLLIIELKAPNISGIVNLTIDAVKYVEGTIIKDVRMNGEKTIKIGVTYDDLPNVLIRNAYVEGFNYYLNFKIIDNSNLLNNNVYLYLFDGEKVQSYNLSMANNIIFDNLELSKHYEYSIIGVYDALDGIGRSAKILYSDAFDVLDGFKIFNINPSINDVTFVIEKLNEECSFEKIGLYLNNELMYESRNILSSFDNLKPNQQYEIRLMFKFDQAGTIIHKTISYYFNTLNVEQKPFIVDSIRIDMENKTYQYEMKDKNELNNNTIVYLKGERLINGELVEFKYVENSKGEFKLNGDERTMYLSIKYLIDDGDSFIQQELDIKDKNILIEFGYLNIETNKIDINEEENILVFGNDTALYFKPKTNDYYDYNPEPYIGLIDNNLICFNYTVSNIIDGICYLFDGDYAYVKSTDMVFNNGEEFNIIIPATVHFKDKEYIVTKIMSNFGSWISSFTYNDTTQYFDSPCSFSIVLPDTITEIESYAFYQCNIVSINIPKNVTKINDYCFYNCFELRDISLSESLLEIGDYAFYGCENIEFVLPKSVNKIGKYSFSFTKVTLDKDSALSIIEEGAFSFSRTPKFIIPSSIERIEKRAFYSIDTYTYLYLTTGIDIYEYPDCTIDGINWYIIPTFGREIERSYIEELTFMSNDHLQYVGDEAFYGILLDTLILPKSVKQIGDNIINDSNITYFEIGKVESMGNMFTKSRFDEGVERTIKLIGDSNDLRLMLKLKDFDHIIFENIEE